MSAIIIDITCYSVTGEELTGVKGFSYLDLQVEPYLVCGESMGVPLPDNRTRKIEVVIKQYVTTYGSVIDIVDGRYSPCDYKEKVSYEGAEREQYLKEICELYKATAATPYLYKLQPFNEYKVCACGRLLFLDAAVCPYCSVSLDALTHINSKPYLAMRIATAESLRQERAQKKELAEKEQKEQLALKMAMAEKRIHKRKQLISGFLKLSAASLCLTLIFAVMLGVNRFSISGTLSYFNAQKLMKAGEYDLAAQTFELIPDLFNSQELILVCRYYEAMVMMDNGYYTEAIKAFKAFPDLYDSSDLILKCRYMRAMGYLEKNKYSNAIDDLSQIGDYQDTNSILNEICAKRLIEVIENKDYGAVINSDVIFAISRALADEQNKEFAEVANKYSDGYNFLLGRYYISVLKDFTTGEKYMSKSNLKQAKESLKLLEAHKKYSGRYVYFKTESTLNASITRAVENMAGKTIDLNIMNRYFIPDENESRKAIFKYSNGVIDIISWHPDSGAHINSNFFIVTIYNGDRSGTVSVYFKKES